MGIIERTYFPSGKVELEYETLDGFKHGVFRRYYENGMLASESHYARGIRNGTWRSWYENGQIEEEGWNEEGKEFVRNFWLADGTQTMKDGTGTLVRTWPPFPGSDIFEQHFENYVWVSGNRIGTHQ